MRWPRDVVADRRKWIGSARSLLTVTTPVMAVGMAADRIEIEITGLAISLDAIAAIATGIVTTGGVADAVIAIAIGRTDAGVAGSKKPKSADYTDSINSSV